MWAVNEAKQADKQLARLPKDILRRYEKWKDVVTTEGPTGLQRIRGFRDHALSGEWEGARSSSLNDQWRVIYVVQNAVVSILVLEVTPRDYRREL